MKKRAFVALKRLRPRKRAGRPRLRLRQGFGAQADVIA